MFDPLRAKAKVVLYSTVAFVFGMGLASGLGWTDASMAMPVVDETPRVSEEAVQPALDLSDAFVNIADQVTPAVVRIEARRPVRSQSMARNRIPEPFRRFFEPGEPGQGEGRGQDGLPPRGQLSGGSGFIISADGYILTNDHVVSDADQLRVYLRDRRYFDARVVGTDPFTDVAVIKIDVDEELPTLSFGDSEDVRVGEWVLAVGNPGFGSGSQLDYTVTAGIVSARGRGLQLLQRELFRNPETRDFQGYAIEDFIQTDAVINPGNSGGPMVDLRGRVVGINSAIASQTGYYQGYGFAIPVNLARRIMEDLVEYGHVKRPMLGVQVNDVAPEDAEYYGLPAVSGALVQAVTEDSPAERAGIQAEDVIVEIDGRPVGYSGQLQQRVAEHRPGDRVSVTLYRDGERREITARLGEAPINEVVERPVDTETVAEERLGIQVEPMSAEVAEQLGYEEVSGVIISDVQRGSPADRRNVVPGWRLLEINDRPVESASDVRDILADVRPGQVVSLFMGDPTGQTRVVNVRMPR